MLLWAYCRCAITSIACEASGRGIHAVEPTRAEPLSRMKWPAGFEPDNSSVYAHNEIAIAAPPERIWRWLIRAARLARMVQQQRQRRISFAAILPTLRLNDEFKWKTFGANVTSRVITFEPPHELGWDARGVLRAYHGWIIEPDGRRMPRRHRGMPERHRAETCVVVFAPDARARPSELGREPQARCRRRRSLVATRPRGSLRTRRCCREPFPST